MAFVKPIREIGFCINKKVELAKPERTDANGKVWPATEEKHLILVISCDEEEFSTDFGMNCLTEAWYPVSKETWNEFKFMRKTKVKYTASQFGDRVSIKPEAFEYAD